MKHRIRVTDFIVYNFNDGYGKLIIEQLKQGNEDALNTYINSIMYCFAVLRTKCWLMLLWLRK